MPITPQQASRQLATQQVRSKTKSIGTLKEPSLKEQLKSARDQLATQVYNRDGWEHGVAAQRARIKECEARIEAICKLRDEAPGLIATLEAKIARLEAELAEQAKPKVSQRALRHLLDEMVIRGLTSRDIGRQTRGKELLRAMNKDGWDARALMEEFGDLRG